MIVHVVLFTWKNGVSQSQIDALNTAMAQLAEKIPEVRELRFGSDAKFRGGNADYGVVAVFDDQAGWSAYQTSPAHKALVADCITPIAASRVAIQMPV